MKSLCPILLLAAPRSARVVQHVEAPIPDVFATRGRQRSLRRPLAPERALPLSPLALLVACGGGSGVAPTPAPPFSSSQTAAIVTRPDSAAVTAGEPRVTGNVLANDTATNISGQLFVASIDLAFDYDNFVGRPLVTPFGTLLLNRDGSFTYVIADNPEVTALSAGQAVQDAFGYYAAAGSITRATSETLTITVTGVNDAPSAVADTGAATENQTASFAVLANDTDPDAGDTKSLLSIGPVVVTSANSAVDGSQAAGAFSMVNGEIQLAPGTIFDALAAGQEATVTIGYTMRDAAGATSSATLTLTIAGEAEAQGATGFGAQLLADILLGDAGDSGSVFPGRSGVLELAGVLDEMNYPVAVI